MARRPRLIVPGAAYHVMSRGNRKAAVFEDDEDRRCFLTVLDEATCRYEMPCYSYCLMGNHYHLVVASPRGNLSRAMKLVNGRYSKASNRHHGRTGHLFGERFESLVVETEKYLRDLARYVALNPVRAGLVQDPALWPWSSYRATIGLEPPPRFLDLSWLNWTFGGATPQAAQARYRLFVNDALAETADIDVEMLSLGTASFDRALRRDLEAEHGGKRLPRAHRALGRPLLSELFGPATQRRQERNQAIRDAHIQHGYTLREIAAFLDLHPSTPSAIVRRLEPTSSDT